MAQNAQFCALQSLQSQTGYCSRTSDALTFSGFRRNRDRVTAGVRILGSGPAHLTQLTGNDIQGLEVHGRQQPMYPRRRQPGHGGQLADRDALGGPATIRSLPVIPGGLPECSGNWTP